MIGKAQGTVYCDRCGKIAIVEYFPDTRTRTEAIQEHINQSRKQGFIWTRKKEAYCEICSKILKLRNSNK